MKLIKKAIVIGALILAQGCVSYDLVHVETYTSGQKPVKGTAVKQIKYGDGFKWVGVYNFANYSYSSYITLWS